jgi:hypothetical protein
MLKAAIHIHSTYSDGELTLSQLREIFAPAGCSFVCTSDHAEAFDQKKLERYSAECEALSDPGFRFVPGLEFECDERMHILGYGLLALLETKSPEEVIRGIESRGGISVIAHPKDTMFEWIERFNMLPSGIEVWNTKYDGQYAPRPETFRLLANLQRRKPELLAFYGQDLHWERQYRKLFNWVSVKTLERDSILEAFRCGQYHASDGELELPSSGRVPEEVLARFGPIQNRSTRLRQWLKCAKETADSVGITVPNSIKSNLRRIF